VLSYAKRCLATSSEFVVKKPSEYDASKLSYRKSVSYQLNMLCICLAMYIFSYNINFIVLLVAKPHSAA